MKTIAVLTAACAIILPSGAAVRLGMPFADHMVLQREKPVAVWGTADPGEKIVVSFAGKTAETTDGFFGGKTMENEASFNHLAVSGAASRANSLRYAMAMAAEFAGEIGNAGKDI